MELNLKKLIENLDYEGLSKVLANYPNLANDAIALDDQADSPKAHPLHRICDGSFGGLYTPEQAAELAKIFLAYGANVDGYPLQENQDTPLVAAASLCADPVALLYIDHGANIHHPGCSGGTALHWAAYCGRDVVVKRLLEEGAEINKRCVDYEATPVLWALEGIKQKMDKFKSNQIECLRLLIRAGADTSLPNHWGNTVKDYITDEDQWLKEIFKLS